MTGNWNTWAMLRRCGVRPVTSVPSNFTLPCEGFTRPETMFSSVVLPQPEGPQQRIRAAVFEVHLQRQQRIVFVALRIRRVGVRQIEFDAAISALRSEHVAAGATSRSPAASNTYSAAGFEVQRDRLHRVKTRARR